MANNEHPEPPLVTVVVPCYRGGPFLREAVKSVQAQSIDNWEVVIVSDGSDDDFSDIEGSDSRIRIFRQPNRGVSIARNVGVRLARAEFVALLDEDDRMLPELLREQLATFGDVNVALCHTQFEYIDEEGRVTQVGRSNDSQYRDFLGGDGRIRLSSSMLRKSAFLDVGGFNPLLPVSEDLDLFYRVARYYRVAFIAAVLAQYRIHTSNMQFHSRAGGREARYILRGHLFLATANDERENVRAIRRGLASIPSDRGARAIGRVIEARSRHRNWDLLRAYAGALIVAPRVTYRLTLREWRTRE